MRWSDVNLQPGDLVVLIPAPAHEGPHPSDGDYEPPEIAEVLEVGRPAVTRPGPRDLVVRPRHGSLEPLRIHAGAIERLATEADVQEADAVWQAAAEADLERVWVVVRHREVDGVYVFSTKAPAVEFHQRYADTSTLSEEVVMSDSAARQFLIEEGHEEPAEEAAEGSSAEFGVAAALAAELREEEDDEPDSKYPTIAQQLRERGKS